MQATAKIFKINMPVFKKPEEGFGLTKFNYEKLFAFYFMNFDKGQEK